MFQTILGKSPLYSFEADPCIIKKNGSYYLYCHDLLGIKELISSDGFSFKHLRYIVLGAIRPFVDNNILYYEKISSYLKFPFFHSQLRSRSLLNNLDKLITNTYRNSCCPSIINNFLFYSTSYQKMDHGWCEPTVLKIHNGPSIIGLDNISSIRKFGNYFLGTLIEVKNGISHAKIVNCIPLKFPNIWKIGHDYLCPSDISPQATHVYIPSIVDKKLYINVRFGRNPFSSEKILVKSL